MQQRTTGRLLLSAAVFTGSLAGDASGSEDLWFYTISNGQLIRYQLDAPEASRVVGEFDLAGGWMMYSLCYAPVDDGMYGLALIEDPPGSFVYSFWQINRATAGATLIREFPSGTYEAFDFVEPLGKFVVAQASDVLTDGFASLGFDGTLEFLWATGVDSDWGGYHGGLDRFLSLDPNGSGQMVATDLGTGSVTTVGSVGFQWRDLAFNEALGGLFGIDLTAGSLLQIDTNGGAGPISSTSLGQIDGSGLFGLAIAPLPSVNPDVNGDAAVDFDDLLLLLTAWGPCASCPEDVDNDGTVGFNDLIVLLAAFE